MNIPELPTNVNALYEIDQAEVAASVQREIAGYWKDQARLQLDPLYLSKHIRNAREYYSTVKIVEFADRGREKYFLVYNNDFAHGTGGFSSLQKAAQWFVNGGR